MPKVRKQDNLPANKQKGNKQCTCCHEEKKLTDYYISKSPLFSIDERVPVCKNCIIKSSLKEDGSIDDLELNKILRKIDKPYYKDLIDSAIKQFKKENSYIEDEKIIFYGKELLQNYFKLIAMRQDRYKSYEDSEIDGFIHQTSNTSRKTKEEISSKYSSLSSPSPNHNNDSKYYSEIGNFVVTEEIKDLFGDGYSSAEYKKMNEKYEKLKQNYILQTNLHQEALVTYVRFKIKEEEATASGNVDEAKKWYDAAQNAADKAKLSPKQLTKADLQKGLNSFSEISQALEQVVDIIQILPRFKSQPNDSVDFNIWCYINYARKLKGLPTVPYEDIYRFYDDMKDEYIAQYGDPYGIFDDDTTVKNRENVKKFITLPTDYDSCDEDAEDSGGDID